MIENMEWYGWAALGAFLCKAYLVIESKQYDWADSRWYLLAAGFISQNLSELAIYSSTQESSIANFTQLYFVSTFILGLAILNFVSDTRNRTQRFLLASHALLVIVIVALILAGKVIGGIEKTDPIVAEKLALFPVYVAVATSGLISIIFCIAQNYSSRHNADEQCEQLYHVLAFTPFIVVAAYFCAWNLLGFNVNTSGLFPIATTLFMWISYRMKCKSAYLIRRDPRSYLPGSPESELHSVACRSLYRFASQRSGLENAISDVEKSMLEYAVRYHRGHKSKIARELGLSRRTLDRRLKKHKIYIT